MTAVIVIGSGFAGLWAALGAARRLDELAVPAGMVEITVLSAKPFHDIRVRNYEAGPPYNDLDALRWANGRWQSAERTRQHQCSRTSDRMDTTYTTTWSMSLELQSSDGSSYSGTLVQTVLANDCSMQVGTERSIFAARRIGRRPRSADW